MAVGARLDGREVGTSADSDISEIPRDDVQRLRLLTPSRARRKRTQADKMPAVVLASRLLAPVKQSKSVQARDVCESVHEVRAVERHRLR